MVLAARGAKFLVNKITASKKVEEKKNKSSNYKNGSERIIPSLIINYTNTHNYKSALSHPFFSFL